MATKRLERTAIEGGRSRYNKWERRHSNAQLRAKVRPQVARWARDPDSWDADVPGKRRTVWRDFSDKLGPVERWLYAQVGRPWRDVEGQILRKFDTRSLAGRHVVFDHLLPGSWRGTPRDGWGVNGRWTFRVDDAGILRVAPCAAYQRPHAPRVRQVIAAWIGIRRLTQRGTRWYWMLPAWTANAQWTTAPPRFRQGQPLDAEETARALSLNPAERERFVLSFD